MLYILICSAGTYSRYEILNPRVEDMHIYIYIYVWEFSDCFAGDIVLPSHTFAYHEWGPIPGSVKLRNRGVV